VRIGLQEETAGNDSTVHVKERAQQMSTWQEDKEERRRLSLESHSRLSKLFREDRLAFGRERKRLIEEVIQSASGEEQKERLRVLQATWDKRMRGAGSAHNRLVLAQTFFWDHFQNTWRPAIRKVESALKKKKKV
jgi:hypothetical protein